MELANAIARLERAGSENSKGYAKLVDAAGILASWIEYNVPTGVTLPRDYKVIRIRSNVGSELFLVAGIDTYIDGSGGYLHGDFSCRIPAPTRSALLKLAKDVAEGWLTEIAEFLEKRAKRSNDAADTMLTAVPKE